MPRSKVNHHPPADEPAATLFDELDAIARFDQMFSNDQLEQLKQPLDKKRIKHRPQGGRQVSYLDGAGVIDKANEIFKPGCWGYTLHKVEDRQNGQGGIYIAYIRLQIIDPETRQPAPPIDEVGTGEYFKPTAGEIDKAIKSAITDAVKRALRCYGNQFGLSLYGGEDELATPSTRDEGEPKPETKIRRPTTDQQRYNAPDGAVLLSRQVLSDGPGAAKAGNTTNPLPQPRETPQKVSKPGRAIPYVPNEDVFNYKRRLDKATAEQLDLIAVEIRADKDLTEMDREYLRGTFSERRNYFNGLLDEQEAQHETEQTGAA